MVIYIWSFLLIVLNPVLAINDSALEKKVFSTGTSSRPVVILDANDAYLMQDFGWIHQYLTRRERVALALTAIKQQQ